MNILLSDDDRAIRGSLGRFLTGIGHQVREAPNGKEAYKSLMQHKTHLLLSDIRMPHMDGHELLKKVKSTDKLKYTAVVLFTGFGDIRHAVEAMRDGAMDYLLKPVDVDELRIIIDRLSEYLALKEENQQLTNHFDKAVVKATQDITDKYETLKKAYAKQVGTFRIGVFSETLRKVFKIAELFHLNPQYPVLLEGETGTGKEIIARFIHYGQGNVSTPFVAVNCAAVSSTLFESELFGYEPGAFTGGNPNGQIGKLELASGGTLFLDEIGELGQDLQAKFLRVIQEKEFYRIGGLKKITANVRFICATNRDVKKCTADNTFRPDLFYRLNVGYLRIPPLRERSSEILPLALMYLEELRESKRTNFRTINPEAAKMLTRHDWPGNVRELKHTIERSALMYDGTEVLPNHLDFIFQSTSDESHLKLQAQAAEYNHKSPQKDSALDIALPGDCLDLNKYILELVGQALHKHKWNKTATANYLSISRTALYTYIKKLEVAS
jgi:two-component system, NtrC family, response regulator AtoC